MQIPDKHWLVLTELPGHFRNLYVDCPKPGVNYIMQCHGAQ